MKKIIAIILALLLVLSFSACGATKEEDDSFKYGFISWGTADEHGRTLNAACQWAVEAAGGEFVMDAAAFTTEAMIASAENLIQSGCNMISFCTYIGEAIVPSISRLCQQNKVYWTMWDTTISDPEVKALIEADPYFVGTTNEDQYTSGYNTMKEMIKAGAKNVLVIKYATNVPTCDERCNGAEAAAKEAGVKLLYEIVAPEDYKKATADALVAYPQTDAVFMAGGATYVSDVLSAAKETGKKVVIGAFDYFDNMGTYLQSGELVCINGGHMVTATFSALMAINAYQGNALSKDKYQITVPYLTLTSYEDYQTYLQYASNGAAYTAEEMKQFLKKYNSSLTLESFQEMCSKWSVSDIIARKSK